MYLVLQLARQFDISEDYLVALWSVILSPFDSAIGNNAR